MAQAVIDIVLSNGQKAGTTLKELQQTANRLKKEINDLEPGSEKWVKKTEDFKKVTGRLGDLRGELKGVKKEQESLMSSFLKIVPFGGQIQQLGGRFTGLRSSVGGLTGGFKLLKAAIAATGIGILLIAIASLVTWFTKTEKGAKLLSAAMAGIQAVLGSVTGFVKDLVNSLAGLGSAWTKLMKGDFKGAGQEAMKVMQDIADAAKKMGTNVRENFEEGFALERAKQNLKDFEREMERSINASQAVFDIQSAIADDATRSFAEREKAAQMARLALEDTAAAEKRLAAERFSVLDREYDINKRNGTLNEELKEAYVAAQIAKQQADTNYTRTLIDNEKQISELKQDRLERDLDILIDGFDNVKTVNEKIITDDERTFEERRNMLDSLKKLSDDSFAEQIKTIEQFTDKQVDANDLLATSDAKLLNEKIRGLGLSEIIEGRLLEIIRERRIATSDLAELEKQINLEQKAADQKKSAEQKAKDQAAHDERLKNFDLLNEEMQVRIEELRQEGLLSEDEYQQEIFDLQRGFLEARLQENINFYTSDSEEARLARLELEKFLQDSYNRDKEAFRKTQQEKKAQFFQVTNALSGAAMGFFDMQIQAEHDRLEAQKANLKEGQSLRVSEYNKLKKQQKTQTVIAGITEVANIWSSVMQLGPIAGPILGAILTGLAIARTIKNVQAIDSQKFAKGGAIRRLAMGGMLRGPLHRDGGIPGRIKSTGQPIEMEDGEIILNRRVGLDPAGLAAASELNARYGGVRFFQTGGPINPLSTPTGSGSSSAAANAQESQAISRETAEIQRQQLEETRMFRADINNWQREFTVNNYVSDTKKGIDVINKLRDDAAF